jgi:hypothetical protein
MYQQPPYDPRNQPSPLNQPSQPPYPQSYTPPPSPILPYQHPQSSYTLPHKPRLRKPRRWPWIVAIILALLVGSALASSHNSTTTTPTAPKPGSQSAAQLTRALATSTTQHTTLAHPTVQPVATIQSTVASNNGPALLGSTISTFFAQYGQPNSHTNVKNGMYHWQKYADSNVDEYIIQTDIFDQGAYAPVVLSITVNADNNGWDAATTKSMVGRFLPRDAAYKSQVELPNGNGYDKIYYSATLAKQFPSSEFTDVQQNPIKAGTFDVQCLTNPDRTINDCTIQVGTQQTQ